MSKHWIEQRLAEIGRLKSEFADALRIDRSRVSELVGGRRRLSVSELPAVSRFLGLTVADVLRLETGDPGFLPEGQEAKEQGMYLTGSEGVVSLPHEDGAFSTETDKSTSRIYSATKEALNAFNRYGLDEMSPTEIDTYAKVIARCATRPEYKDAVSTNRNIQSKAKSAKPSRNRNLS